jgi:L-malate glycosyltransferase
MKLCLVANPNSVHTRRWVKYFSQEGLEIHLVGEHTPLRPPPDNCEFYDLTRTTNLRKARYLVWSRALHQLVRQIKPDILQALSLASAGWLATASNYHPFVATAIGSDLMLLEKRSILHRQLTTWALKRADFVTCVSKGLATKARQLGVDQNKVDVVYIGVNLGIFHPGSVGDRDQNKLTTNDQPLVLSIRAINPIYNPLDIARAMLIVLKQFPGARFAVFTYNNDPATLAAFKAIIAAENVSNSVIFVDPLSDDNIIANFYRAADIAISIPSSDGTPASVLEAMACGTAVIASDLPSLHDWIIPEQNGIIVPVGDVNALANAILRLLQDPGFRERLGSNATATVQEQGDHQVWIQQMMKIYHDLAK